MRKPVCKRRQKTPAFMTSFMTDLAKKVNPKPKPAASDGEKFVTQAKAERQAKEGTVTE